MSGNVQHHAESATSWEGRNGNAERRHSDLYDCYFVHETNGVKNISLNKSIDKLAATNMSPGKYKAGPAHNLIFSAPSRPFQFLIMVLHQNEKKLKQKI